MLDLPAACENGASHAPQLPSRRTLERRGEGASARRPRRRRGPWRQGKAPGHRYLDARNIRATRKRERPPSTGTPAPPETLCQNHTATQRPTAEIMAVSTGPRPHPIFSQELQVALTERVSEDADQQTGGGPRRPLTRPRPRAFSLSGSLPLARRLYATRMALRRGSPRAVRIATKTLSAMVYAPSPVGLRAGKP